MNCSRLLTLLSVILFCSCSSSELKNRDALNSLNESLERTGKMMIRNSQAVQSSFQDKLTEPSTYRAFSRLYPAFKRVRSNTGSVLGYINEIKIAIKQAAHLKSENGKQIFDEGDKDAVRTVIYEQGHGKSLHSKLLLLRDSLRGIDERIAQQFGNDLHILPAAFDSSADASAFVDQFFEGSSALQAIIALNQFENNVLMEELRLLAFLHEQVAIHSICYIESPKVMQSSTVVKAGEELTIEAGIGYFRNSDSFRVKVGNETVLPGPNGVTVYQFKTGQKKGRFEVPVEIRYLDQDLKMVVVRTKVRYTVVE
jgi:hypothetical protein